MEVFKEAWFAIDTTGKNFISAQDLEQYMREHQYEDAFVEKWMRVFDQDNSGTIEIEEYCDVLGLNYKEVIEENRARIESSGMPDGVEFIAGDMATEMQIQIAKLCIEGLQKEQKMANAVKWIKMQADLKLNPLWHIVLIRGQFWCYFGYEPGMSYVFRYGKYVFVTWRSPSV